MQRRVTLGAAVARLLAAVADRPRMPGPSEHALDAMTCLGAPQVWFRYLDATTVPPRRSIRTPAMRCAALFDAAPTFAFAVLAIAAGAWPWCLAGVADVLLLGQLGAGARRDPAIEVLVGQVGGAVPARDPPPPASSSGRRQSASAG